MPKSIVWSVFCGLFLLCEGSSCVSVRNDCAHDRERQTDLRYPGSWVRSETFGTMETGKYLPLIYYAYLASGDNLLAIAKWYCDRLYSEGWSRFACLDESVGYEFPVWGGVFWRNASLIRVEVLGPLFGDQFIGSVGGPVVYHEIHIQVLRGDGVLPVNRPRTGIDPHAGVAPMQEYAVVPDAPWGSDTAEERERFRETMREYEDEKRMKIWRGDK